MDRRYALADRIIDPVTGNVSWRGNHVHLQRKDLEVLALLASNPNTVVARASFIAVVWDDNYLVGERGLSDKIFSLRRALADHDDQHPIIRTIPKRGYQLTCAPIQPVPGERASFIAGTAVPHCPGWRLLRRLSESDISESWLAQSEELASAQRVFSFCRSEAHLRRLNRETTLLRYLAQSLGERKDLALVRDWQLEEPPYFLARDHCAFGTLNEWAHAIGGLATQSLAQRKALMQALVAAVASIHEIGVVHGQLSTDSVLLDTGEGDAPQLKLGAFDLGALQDRSKLTPLQITAAGLSFVDGEHTPKATDDIAALGLLLLRLAVADLKAEPTEECLARLPIPSWRSVLSACLGPESQRPSAADLQRRLNGAAATDVSAKPAPVPASTVLLGQYLGPYRLTDKLGEGGMGTVYLAEQREPVHRQVAVKVILAGMNTAEVLARFEAERQALALMNHVNVASVFDAGSSDTGRPYFAMEYVPGLDITAHCDQRQLDFRGRMELFFQVCDGVVHAHQKGIIHRDLKPSNILIKTAHGQPATAKIIDFGVAKSLQGKLGSLTAYTQLGSFVGTRSYSSPEQVSGHAGLDTRTDIYSLGVILYELLAGVTPFDKALMESKSPIELTKILSSQEPPALLKRFAGLKEDIEIEIATSRKLTVAQMKKNLNSDLAWIVAKCLERDPNDRYASVLELQKDLRRWLENRPVEARPITWRYRMRKMVRRNWGAVALGSSAVLSLLATTTVAVVSYLRSEQAREEAERVANFQATQLEAIDPTVMGKNLRQTLLEHLKSGNQPNDEAIASQLESVNMTDVAVEQLDDVYLNPALLAIESDFKDTPLIQARLLYSMATVLHRLDQPSKAFEVLEPALTHRRELLGDLHPLTLELLLLRGRINLDRGLRSEAEADLRMALDAYRREMGPRYPKSIEAQIFLGYALLTDYRDQDAFDILSDALLSARIVLGPNHELTLDTTMTLGIASNRLLRPDDAEKLFVEALKGYEQRNDRLKAAYAKREIANLLEAKGNSEASMAYKREVLDRVIESYGNNHSFSLAARHNLAIALEKKGEIDESIAEFRMVLDGCSRLFGAKHPKTLTAMIGLGSALREAKQFDEAKQLLESALATTKTRPADSGTILFDVLFELGLLAKTQGKLDEAKRLLMESLEGRRRLSGATHMDTKASLEALDDLAEMTSAITGP